MKDWLFIVCVDLMSMKGVVEVVAVVRRPSRQVSLTAYSFAKIAIATQGKGRRCLFRLLAQTAEVIDDFSEVVVGVHVEAVPYIAQQHSAAKADVFELLDVIVAHATQGHHLAVDDFAARILLQLALAEMCGVVVFRDAVEYGREEYVVARFLVLHHFLDSVAGATDAAFVFGRQLRVAAIEVHAFEAVLAFQIEMVVHDDALPVLLWNEHQETFGIDRFGVRFSQMQDFKALFEERRQYLMLFNKKVGGCH